MTSRPRKPQTIPSLFRPHPWHGLEVGPGPPSVLYAFIEMTPFDLIKYEVDKQSGYLRVDRPQRGSSQPPAARIESVHGRAHAERVVQASIRDYVDAFGGAG